MKVLLPIGSIVSLKKANKKIMVSGYLEFNQHTLKYCLYRGCNYPGGYNDDIVYSFDAEDIDYVYFVGAQDLYSLSFRERINDIYTNIGKKSEVDLIIDLYEKYSNVNVDFIRKEVKEELDTYRTYSNENELAVNTESDGDKK